MAHRRRSRRHRHVRARSGRATFRIVDTCLDGWTLDMLDDEIRHLDWGPRWAFTRGAVIQRVFTHDVYHIAEANETLGTASLRQIDLWED